MRPRMQIKSLEAFNQLKKMQKLQKQSGSQVQFCSSQTELAFAQLCFQTSNYRNVLLIFHIKIAVILREK